MLACMDGGIELSVLNVERELTGNAGPGIGIGTGTELGRY